MYDNHLKQLGKYETIKQTTFAMTTTNMSDFYKDYKMEFYEVLEKRRTYRDFSDREVSDEILKRVIGAAFKAPTNDHLRQFEFVVVRERENIAKVIAPLAKNMTAFKELVAEVDELGDKDKMAMFADALPKQQKMLMESGLLIIPFFRHPILSPAHLSATQTDRTKFTQLFRLCMVRSREHIACCYRRRLGSRVPYSRGGRGKADKRACPRP